MQRDHGERHSIPLRSISPVLLTVPIKVERLRLPQWHLEQRNRHQGYASLACPARERTGRLRRHAAQSQGRNVLLPCRSHLLFARLERRYQARYAAQGDPRSNPRLQSQDGILNGPVPLPKYTSHNPTSY